MARRIIWRRVGVRKLCWPALAVRRSFSQALGLLGAEVWAQQGAAHPGTRCMAVGGCWAQPGPSEALSVQAPPQLYTDPRGSYWGLAKPVPSQGPRIPTHLVLGAVFWGKLALFGIFLRPCEHDAVVCARRLSVSWFSQLLPCPG